MIKERSQNDGIGAMIFSVLRRSGMSVGSSQSAQERESLDTVRAKVLERMSTEQQSSTVSQVIQRIVRRLA